MNWMPENIIHWGYG